MHLQRRPIERFLVVELRPIVTGDAERLFEWRNLPEVRRYMFTDLPIRREEHDRWFKSVLVDATRRDWIIQTDGVPAGLISLTSIDEHNARCSWGFYIASQALRGRGLGSSAWFQTLRYAFDDLELEKVSSEVLDTNLSVIALHERFGFRREAYFRSHVRRGDERIDVIGLAMLRADWQLCRPGIEDQLRRNERSHADLKGK